VKSIYKLQEEFDAFDDIKWTLYKKTWYGGWKKIKTFYRKEALLNGLRSLITAPIYTGTLQQLYMICRERYNHEDKD